MSSLIYYAVCVGDVPGVYETEHYAKAAAGKARIPLVIDYVDKETANAAVSVFEDADVVYTDGSARSNGATGVGVFWAHDDPRNVSRSVYNTPPTNNVAELEAIEEALNAASASTSCRRLVIVTDSMYAMRAVTEWHHTWAKNGWRTTAGTPVKNASLIRSIIDKLSKLDNVALFHVRGHRHVGNDEADRLAGAASGTYKK